MKTEIRRPERIEALFSGTADLPERLPEEIGGDAILWVGQPKVGFFEMLWRPIVEVTVILVAITAFLGVLAFLELLQGLVDNWWALYLLSGLLLGVRILYRLLLLRRFKDTLYIVTDRQAIIAEDKPNQLRVVSFEGKHFQRLVRRERKDGAGDLLFEGVWPTDLSEAREFENGFYKIENVAEVERLIRKNLLSGK